MNYRFDAVVLDIHDGDTARLAVRLKRARGKTADLGFHIHTEDGWLTVHIAGRLVGLNAPELATPDGQAALAYIKTLIAVGDVVSIASSKPAEQIAPDKYGGRWDVVITKAGLNVNDQMVSSGHARLWDGTGPKPV